jgi:hypothetical protein
LGALLELILIIANIGTAVVLYPILKWQNEILILGYVTARVMECVFIAVGLLSLLTIVTLRQEATAGADAASLVTAGKSLVALHDWTFLLGPGFFVGVGCCSESSRQGVWCRASRPYRRLFGSCRSAYGPSSGDSIHLRSLAYSTNHSR